MLDSVLEDAKDLNRKLGGSDQQKLDQYLSGVRELEQRIARAEPLTPAVAARRRLPARPASPPT